MLLLLHCVIDDYMVIWDFVFISSNLCKVFERLFVSVISINRILNPNHRGGAGSLQPFFPPSLAAMIYLRTAKMSSIPMLCKLKRTHLKHDSKLQMIKIVRAHNYLSETWYEKIDLIK